MSQISVAPAAMLSFTSAAGALGPRYTYGGLAFAWKPGYLC
jgi:hypothetical protein